MKYKRHRSLNPVFKLWYFKRKKDDINVKSDDHHIEIQQTDFQAYSSFGLTIFLRILCTGLSCLLFSLFHKNCKTEERKEANKVQMGKEIEINLNYIENDNIVCTNALEYQSKIDEINKKN